jgi:hypothetical protein
MAPCLLRLRSLHIGQVRVAQLRVVKQPTNLDKLRMLSARDLADPAFAASLFAATGPEERSMFLCPQTLLPQLAQSLALPPGQSMSARGGSKGLLLGGETFPSSKSVPTTAHLSPSDGGVMSRTIGNGNGETHTTMLSQAGPAVPVSAAVQDLLQQAAAAPLMSMTDIALRRQRAREQTLSALAVPGHQRGISTPEPPALTPHEHTMLDAARRGDWPLCRQAISDAPDAAENVQRVADRTTSPLRVNINASLPQHGATALHYAALSGSVETVEGLLGLGATVDAMTHNGSTPLHWAAGAGHLAVCQVLLQHRASPTARSSTWSRSVFGKGSGQTPSHWAAESGHQAIVAYLAQFDPLSVVEQDERRQTPLALAEKENRKEVMNYLATVQNEAVYCIEVVPVWSATTSLAAPHPNPSV